MPSRLLAFICLLVLLVPICWNVRAAERIWNSSLIGGDPAPHFVTGVMVSDYLKTSLGSNPVAFAESFYVRFPKVAFGHWPPVYYFLQALWYAFFPSTPNSARCLSAVTAFGLALLLFFQLRRAHGWIAALCAGALFCVLPGIQDATWDVKSDLLTGLFVFLAIMVFADWLDRPTGWRSPILFAIWSVLAILTKGSAWALGPFAMLAPLLAGRTGCYRKFWYWASGVIILVAGAPFYIWMRRQGVGYPADFSHLASGATHWERRVIVLRPLLAVIPWWLLVVAGIGFLYAVWRRYRAADQSAAVTAALIACAWIVSQIAFLLVLPLTEEGRVYTPALAPAAMLFGMCLQWLQRRLVTRPALAVVAPVAVTILCCLSCGTNPIHRIDGYRSASDAIPFHPGGSTILISSPDEGAFVADRLTGDRQRSGVVILASHALAVSTWSGYRYRLVFPDAPALKSYLMDLPVRYIVLDASEPMQPHTKLLAEVIRSDPEDFHLLGDFPLRNQNGEARGSLLVYENGKAGDRHPAVVRVRLGLDLGARIMEYHWR
jgi:hypothetical protein